KRKGKSPTRRAQPKRGKGHKPRKVARASKQPRVRAQTPPFAPSIFTVTNDQLAHLAAQAAVELLRDVLRAEARRIGLPVTNLNLSNWAEAPHGGRDETVHEQPG